MLRTILVAIIILLAVAFALGARTLKHHKTLKPTSLTAQCYEPCA